MGIVVTAVKLEGRAVRKVAVDLAAILPLVVAPMDRQAMVSISATCVLLAKVFGQVMWRGTMRAIVTANQINQ
jgi:hypothetical protein